ncbi:MAG: PAS domain S-box protein, partial [Marinilabiliales bacterium]|nr:PAS domain S-box protein [Marinilabiliales bacterium]
MAKVQNQTGKDEVVIVAKNVTERKRAEMLLRIRETENRAIVEAVPDLLFKLDRNGTFLDYRNNRAIRPLISPDQFLGRRIREVLPPEVADQSMDALGKAFNTLSVSDFEYSIKFDDNLRFYENRITAVSENVAISFVRDITTKKQNEIAVRDAVQKLSVLIHSLSDGVLFEDAEQRVSFVNPAFCKLFNLSGEPEQWVGSDFRTIILDQNQASNVTTSFIDRMVEIAQSGLPVFNEEIAFSDGSTFERDYIPVLVKDELIGHLWQYRDISEQKLFERNSMIERTIGFSLTETLTIDKALELVVKNIIQIDCVDMVGIYLLNEQRDELELKISHGFKQNEIEQIVKIKRNEVPFRVFRKNIAQYGHRSEMIGDIQAYLNEGLQYYGIVPIIHEKQTIGSINVGSKMPYPIKNATKRSLEIIATLLGGAMERIQIENALAKSQLNFNLLFHTINDFMFVLDRNGQIINTNPIVEKRLGYTGDELKMKTIFDLHARGEADLSNQTLQDAIDGLVDIYSIPLVTKDLSEIPVETKVIIGKWDDKEVVYAISRDISERIKAAEKLRRSESRWQFALEGAGDGLWDLNLDTFDVYYSTTWKTMLGYSEDEIQNNMYEWTSRTHPDDLKRCVEELIDHAFGDAPIYANEHRILCKDGTYKWILDRAKVVERDMAGNAHRIIGVHTDISQRKQFEEQLQKTVEREKELNDLKSRFVSTASHEFRTPLASILMLSEILLKHYDKINPADVLEKLGMIKDHVMQLSEIVNNVLQLSKIKDGKISFGPTEVDLKGLCDHVINSFAAIVEDRNIITFQTSFNQLLCMVDKLLMQQVLTNLVSNALKYAPENPRIEILLEKTDHEIVISVKDNGIGIPQEDQKHMFTPFFRASNTKTIQG